MRPMYPSRILLLRFSTTGKPWNLSAERMYSRERMSRSVDGSVTTSVVMTRETGTPKVGSSLVSRKGKPLNQIIRSAMPPRPKRSETAFVTPTTICSDSNEHVRA